MADKNSDRRAKADAARNAANAGEKKRERMTRIIGAIVVVVVVLGIIGIAVVAKNSSSDSSGGGSASSATANPDAPLPTGALSKDNKYAYGVSLNPNDKAVPVLEIWEDFQCPACQALEKANGAGIEKLAAEGKVQLIWRPTTFLDRNLNNDSSVRAAAAWGCAIDAGKTQEFHNAVYSNPPATEGDGFTDAQLQAFAVASGITGAALDTFNSCLTAGTYQPWALNSTQVFYDANIPGTPLVKINGTEIDPSVAADPAKLEQAVADATK